MKKSFISPKSRKQPLKKAFSQKVITIDFSDSDELQLNEDALFTIAKFTSLNGLKIPESETA